MGLLGHGQTWGFKTTMTLLDTSITQVTSSSSRGPLSGFLWLVMIYEPLMTGSTKDTHHITDSTRLIRVGRHLL